MAEIKKIQEKKSAKVKTTSSVAKKKSAYKPIKRKAAPRKKIFLEIDGQQIEWRAIKDKAYMLDGDVYIVASEKKIYDRDGRSIELFK